MKEIGLFALLGLPVAILVAIAIPILGWLILAAWLLLIGFVGFLFVIELFCQLFPESKTQPPPVPTRVKTDEEQEWEQNMDDALAQLEEVDELLVESAPEHAKRRERALRAADRAELRAEVITT